ncbi:MAG: segregation/condensation protein A [Peptostreptococcaceae bacterium]|nr:segregation/condensation protein A [Peptostreptococcaceae bacterium]
MIYKIALDNYEGPLDILYDMVIKKKIDIYEVSLIDIINQFLKYINNLNEIDLDLAGEFVFFASKLLEIKSKYLLKKDSEEEEEITKEFFDKILDYKKYKNIADKFKEKIVLQKIPLTKKKEEIFFETVLDLESIKIENMISYMLKKENLTKSKTDDEQKLDIIYKTKFISIEEKMEQVKDILHMENIISFKDLITEDLKEEIIATFISILELVKSREIKVIQDDLFSNIKIMKVQV